MTTRIGGLTPLDRTAQVDRCVRVQLDELPPAIVECRSRDAIARDLKSEVDLAFDRCEDLAFCGDFYKSKLIAGTAPADYLHRRAALAEGHLAITGIRFHCGDARHPFVEVIARTFPLHAETQMRELLRGLPYSYKALSPRSVGMRLGAAAQLPPWINCAKESHVYVGGCIAMLQSHACSMAEPRIRLERIADLACYDDYRGLYDQWRLQPHWRREFAAAEERNDFGATIRDGMAFGATVDDTRVGYIAAVPRNEFGMSGFCLMDIVVDPLLRGQRLGAEMLRALIRRLPRSESFMLYAHVHVDNVASARTMAAIGMQEVGAFLLAPL